MTEDQIDRRVEHATDRLDYQLLHGKLTQAEYDHEMMLLYKWAQQQIDALK